MIKGIAISLVCLLSFAHLACAEEKQVEDLYSQLNRAVIRLEYQEEIRREGSNKTITQLKSSGTAFFVQSGGSLFVVSARHVVQQDFDHHARVECLNKKTGGKEVIKLSLPRARWAFHPEQGDKDTHFVDVAAMRIMWIIDRHVKHFIYETPGSENYHLNSLPANDPTPPRRILVFGFPLSIGFQLREQRPFGRSGIIAMRTGEKFLIMKISGQNKFAEERCYLIDAKILPGNSGSPVLNQTSITDSKVQLLGLISAANQGMDFAVAEPVSRLREVIDIARKQNIDGFACWSEMKK